MTIDADKKALIVLEHLQWGHELDMDGHRWALGEDLTFGVILTLENGEERVGSVDLSLTGFLKMCAKLDDDLVIGLAASNALNQTKRHDAKKRTTPH